MIEPGIYFGLDEAVYHADTALGSTDMKALASDPVSWWYYSKHNPDRPEDRDTPALLFGRAVHAMILEGRKALEARFAPTHHPGSTKEGKAERSEARALSRQPIPFDDYSRAMRAGTYVTADPQLAQAFSGGFSEVSVFWERDGIRRKARLDYLKVRSTVDLKSAREQEDFDFPTFCKRELVKRGYYVQFGHYTEAREMMPRLYAQRRVFGPHDGTWLQKIVAEADPAYTWVFFQSGGAPRTFGTYASKGSRLYGLGLSLIRTAEANYHHFSGIHGLDGEPWVQHHSLEPFNEDDVPPYLWGA